MKMGEQALFEKVNMREDMTIALIKEEIREWALSLPVDGVPSLVRANNMVLRVLWLLALLGATSYSSYLIVVSFQHYFEYEVVTKIEQVVEIPMNFPTVTICNKAPFGTEFGANFSKQVMADNNIDYLNSSDVPMVANSYAAYIVGTNAYASPNLTDDQRRALGLSLEEMILSCDFNSNGCNLSEWSWSFNLYYGNCYSFNSGKDRYGNSIKEQSLSRNGWNNGLFLEIYVGESSDIYSLNQETGIHLFVQNKSTFNSFQRGIPLSTGKKSYITVERSFYHNLPAPYSGCTDEETLKNGNYLLVKQFEQAGYTYNINDCFQACYNTYFVSKQCGCRDVAGINIVSDIGPCFNSTQILCNFDVYGKFVSNNIQDQCGDYCPLECDYIDYQLSSYEADFPSLSYYNFLITQSDFMKRFNYNVSAIPYEKAKATMLSTNINYKDLRYIVVTADPKMEILDLIGSIGGQLGLFIGVSLMSVLEVFNLLISIIYIVIREKHRLAKIGSQLATKKPHNPIDIETLDKK